MRADPGALPARSTGALGWLLAALCVLALLIPAHPARAAATPAETVWRLLDYIAVDYPGAIQNGRVISDLEYREMTEFSATARTRIAALPYSAAKPTLVSQAGELQTAITNKTAPETVATLARRLADGLLAAYPVPLAPSGPPDLARAAQLYATQCASCHGATGDGKGPEGLKLDPPPVAFTDAARARERSVFALYQVIEQGLEGTGMQSFAHLPAGDRWGLAFYVGSLAFPESVRAAGERRWRAEADLRTQFPDLAAVTRITPAALAASVGEPAAAELTAYLRRSPGAVTTADTGGSLAVARAKLKATVAAYSAGNRDGAADLALSTYLDGVEPLEPAIAARDGQLLARIEGAMGELRGLIGRGAPLAAVAAQAESIEVILTETEAALAPAADTTSAFVGAFTILLREGLEALLIVVAMVTFLRKAERQDVLPYVHAGWVAALAAGVGTWAAATYLITISGAARELTEGFGALFAALVLVSVGVWMHGKSQADAWQRYIREKLSKALSRRSAWFLFLLAFVVVYREAFETILFFAALWNPNTAPAVLGGAAVAVAVLAGVAWAMLRYSKRLPIGRFFAFSAWLVAVLAVVLVGKGVAALQEGGMLGLSRIAGLPRIEALGVFPTTQTLLAQLVIIAALAAGFWYNGRAAAAALRARTATPPGQR